jgi:hypothetical protein
MFGNAQSMVLHAGRSANVPQNNDLDCSRLLELQRLTPVLHLDGDGIAMVVDKLERLVLVGIILGGQRQQDYGEEHGQDDEGAEDDLEAMVEGVGEEGFAEHGARRWMGGAGQWWGSRRSRWRAGGVVCAFAEIRLAGLGRRLASLHVNETKTRAESKPPLSDSRHGALSSNLPSCSLLLPISESMSVSVHV